MRHSYLEPGLWRYWHHDAWNVEISWGGSFQWFGAKYSQSRDGEVGKCLSFGFWLACVYLTLSRPSLIERNVGAWFDDQHVNVAAYRGDDEMNSMPWMWEWPWKRWHHIGVEQVSPERVYSYTYERESGEKQTTQATCRVEEREWHWIFRGNPFRRTVRRSLWCDFSDPIGESVDSWKGGTTGCGTDLRAGEDMVGALRRMERERRFN